MTSKHLTTLNLDPFLRNAIGVHRTFENMLDRFEHVNTGNYPPYNIVQIDDDNYRVEIAVAGFSKDDISITVEDGQLDVRGESSEPRTAGETFLHQGISARAFERHFALADHVEVKGASVINGILMITLQREVPEALKPKLIEIK